MARTARLYLGQEQLRQLLGIPNDVTVRTVFGSPDPAGVVVVVEGDRFDEVPDGAESPMAVPMWRAESVAVDGKRYRRLEWDGS